MATKVIKKKSAEQDDRVANRNRPATVRMEFVFYDDNRKVTPADLNRAGEVAAAAARSYLESRWKPYDIAEINVEVDYTYIHARKNFTA